MPGSATLPNPSPAKTMPMGGVTRRHTTTIAAATTSTSTAPASELLPSPPVTARAPPLLGATAAASQIIPAVAPVGGLLPPLQLVQDNALDRAFLSLLSREIPAIRRTAMVTASPLARLTIDDHASDDATVEVPAPPLLNEMNGLGNANGNANSNGAGSSKGIHAVLIAAPPLTDEMKAEEERRRKDEHIQALRARLRQVNSENCEKIEALEKQLRRADRSLVKSNDEIRRLTTENDELRQRLLDAGITDLPPRRKTSKASKSSRSQTRATSDGFTQSGFPSPSTTSAPHSPHTTIATLPLVQDYCSAKPVVRNAHRDTPSVVGTEVSQDQYPASAAIHDAAGGESESTRARGDDAV